MYIGLRVKYPLFLSDFNGTWMFWTDFRKYWNIKFHEKYIRWEPAGKRTDRQTDGQTWRSQ